jgi:catechol 2,3-dioxygenase
LSLLRALNLLAWAGAGSYSLDALVGSELNPPAGAAPHKLRRKVMDAGTNDSFGAAVEAQSAAPGTYGEPPSGYRLPEATRLGKIRLQVAELERSLAFYQDVLGFRVRKQASGQAALAAADERILIELIEQPGARSASRGGRLGLYHYALLLPDRASLGRFARHLSIRGIPVAASDHLVTEAFYLHDPDELGIEVYADRPRSAWRRVGTQLMIAAGPIDMRGVLSAAADQPWTGMPEETVIGHVHLHVGDLSQAARFFSDALGFDRMTWNYPGALFLGAGGYHHHVGANTWAGAGATPPSAGDAQLLEWTIELPGRAALDDAAESLLKSGHPVNSEEGGDITTRDPWGTAVRLSLTGNSR